LFIAAQEVLIQTQSMCMWIQSDLLPQIEDIWMDLKYGRITIFHVFRNLSDI